MFSWYKYLIVCLFFSHLGFWSGSLFLIAPFPDLCLLVLFCIAKEIVTACFFKHIRSYSPPEAVIRHLVALFYADFKIFCLPGLYRVEKMDNWYLGSF